MTVLQHAKRAALPISRTQISKRFLQLPSSCRSFHATPPAQFYDTAVGAAQSVFEGLHTVTGLPWAYTIPLTALLIRTTFILPISIYQRRVNQKQVALSPLVQSWAHQLRKETMMEVGHLGPLAAQRSLGKKMRSKRREIYKRWRCQFWKNNLQFIQLPIWLTAIEAMRKMSGKEQGLLGMIFGTSTEDREMALAALQSGKELSFTTEGALWFPDLSVADPMLILPFMLSATMFANLYNGAGKNPSVMQRRITNTLKIVALAIGPLTLQVPSAMLLYWISSSSFALIQALVLERLLPIKAPVVPCKPRNLMTLPGEQREKV